MTGDGSLKLGPGHQIEHLHVFSAEFATERVMHARRPWSQYMICFGPALPDLVFSRQQCGAQAESQCMVRHFESTLVWLVPRKNQKDIVQLYDNFI